MKRIIRTTLAAAALAVPVLPSLQAPASAANAAAIVGVGSIAEGVPTGVECTAPGVRVAFDGQAVNLGTDFGPGPYTVLYDATSTNGECIATGGGFGTLSGNISGTASYTRVAGTIILTGNVSVNGSSSRAFTAVCELAPLDANPITTYEVVCAASL